MTDAISEKLQETLFELNRVEEREKKFKEENHAILSAISAMSGASDKVELFNTLLKVIERYIVFENAVVLTRNKDTEDTFTCLVSTTQELETYHWHGKETFFRCVNGQTVVLYAPERVSEFALLGNINPCFSNAALITGLTVNANESILILFSNKDKCFNSKAKQIIERFRPLIERTIMDIDYRERLQCLVAVKTQELAASRQRFRDFAKTASDWFWELNDRFEFTYLSSPSDTGHISDSKSIYLHLKRQPVVKQKLLRLIRLEKSFSDVECQVLRQGEEQWISLSGRPFYDKRAIFLGYRGTAKDITARKRRLQELQHARRQAESANAAKSQFLAMMSHEIRTPLNAVMGLIDIIEQSPLNSDQNLWINQMDKSAQLLLTIINDVLDLARIEADTFELNPENINPRDSVTLVCQQLREICHRKNIEIAISIDQNVPDVIYQDGNRFAQILLNLVGNAVKFTEKGAIQISMKVLNNMLDIEIQDTGIGIELDNEQDIFKPFTQADSSITRKYGGTGLGLSICKNLVTMMAGTIRFSTKIKIGTTFYVSIPLITPCKFTPVKNDNIDIIPTVALRILVAEDSKANQMVVKLILEKVGHHVVVVNNGQEAIDIIEQGKHTFDLVLMDMSMPVICGIEATKELRKKGYNLPIIALTANAMTEDKDKCINAGMNDFVTKPIRSAILKQILQKIKPIT